VNDGKPFFVMAGLVPAIHVLAQGRKTWMPGTGPGMTNLNDCVCGDSFLFGSYFFK